MKQLESALFNILRSALGIEEQTTPITLAPQQWQKLFYMAVQQKVAAIIYFGLETIGHNLPEDLKHQWKSYATFSTQRFDTQLMVLNQLSASLEMENIKMMVLKGLGLALCYPKPELRECADIDIYCIDNYEKVNNFILSSGLGKNPTDTESGDLDFERGFEIGGILVESHRKFCAGDNHAGKYVNNILTEMSSQEPYTDPRLPGIMFPCVQMGALHLIMHTLSHLAWSGIVVRNICDIALYLRRHQSEINFDQLRMVLKAAGIEKSAALLIDICKRHLGLSIDLSVWEQYEADEAETVLHSLFHPIQSSALTRNPFGKLHRKIEAHRFRARLHRLVYGEKFPDPFLKSFACLRR